MLHMSVSLSEDRRLVGGDGGSVVPDRRTDDNESRRYLRAFLHFDPKLIHQQADRCSHQWEIQVTDDGPGDGLVGGRGV